MRLQSNAFHFAVDTLAIIFGFSLGAVIRFGTWFPKELLLYAPAILLASLVGPSIFYIGGLYTDRNEPLSGAQRLRWIFFGWLAALIIVMSFGSIDLDSRVGRGVMLIGCPIMCALIVCHHAIQFRRQHVGTDRAICLVGSLDDEHAIAILAAHSGATKIEGLVVLGDYQPTLELPVLLRINSDKLPIPSLSNHTALLIREAHLTEPQAALFVRTVRYMGLHTIFLSDLCEEIFHAVPLQLVTESWLYHASNQSGVLYIKRLKRLFDILCSLLMGLMLSPFLLIGILVVKLGSKGPIFYQQERLGKLGKPFRVIKLRSMHCDAEKNGPQWSSLNDNRVFPAGKWLRKFRIDEIPQLWNVLKGDMSFVGPRPERQVFVDELSIHIPKFKERLLIQPGLTGWAQVKYPYGACMEDSVRKLEFDLYYMKHMSLLLDFFILLETVRTVVTGGVKMESRQGEMLSTPAWTKLSPEECVYATSASPFSDH